MDDPFVRAIPIYWRLKDVQLGSEQYLNEPTEKQLNDWKSSERFRSEKVWLERLRVMNCDERDFIRALMGTKININSEKYNAIFSLYESIIGESKELKLPPYNDDSSEVNFGPMLAPILNHVFKSFQGCLRSTFFSKCPYFDIESILQHSFQSFNFNLKQYLAPALVDELNLARQAGILNGSSGGERFKDYVLNFTANSEWLEYFFKEYPVLLTRIYLLSMYWLDNLEEILRRLIKDLPEIYRFFNIEGEPLVIHIESGKGDFHFLGRSVAIINFSNGYKIVYKPRNLDVHHKWNELLQWFVTNGITMDYYKYRILSRSNYGWMEYLYPKECESEVQVQRFYQRSGANLAILYVLGGHDFISDNIIAIGEYPCFIDLECLLSPSLPYDEEDFNIASNAGRFFIDSVIRTGLLPVWRHGDINNAGINSGGLSATNQQIMQEVAIWVDSNTDLMRQEKKTIRLSSEDKHLPFIKGVVKHASDYMLYILQGFEQCYTEIIRSRDFLLSDQSPLYAFSDLKFRVLLRDTNTYARIMKEACHPDYVKDAKLVDALYDYLWRAYSNRLPANVIQSEIDQLWNGDIPYFYNQANSTELKDGFDHTVVHNYMGETAMDGIKRRLINLSKKDMEKQIKIINYSFAIFQQPAEVATTQNVLKEKTFNKDYDVLPEVFIQTALKLGHHILDQSFEDDDDISWIGLFIGETHGRWQQDVLSRHLYHGTDGIALFFAYLYRATGEIRFRSVAEKITQCSINAFLSMKNSESLRSSISAYNFPVSTLHLMHNLHIMGYSSQWSPELIDFFLSWIESYIEKDTDYDILLGSAGALICLLNLYEDTKNERALNIASKCGVHLLNNAHKVTSGIAWKGSSFSYLGGFGHGNSGFSWALFRLARVTDEQRFYDAGLMALQYDRSLYCEKLLSWLDIRSETNKVSAAWCNGSAGIGLGRLLLENIYTDDMIEEEIWRAFRHVQQYGLGLTHCLCHGDLGNLEILFALAKRLNAIEVQKEIIAYLHSLISIQSRDKKWKCGMLGRSVELYDLFLGLAGIGYGMLRFADWKNVPSVLALEVPGIMNPCLHL